MEKLGTFLIGLGPTAVAWLALFAVVALVALVAVGKLALVMDALAKLLVKAGEGEINRSFRKKAGVAADLASPVIQDTLANMAAKTDPDPKKPAESKGRRFLKFIGGAVARRFLPF